MAMIITLYRRDNLFSYRIEFLLYLNSIGIYLFKVNNGNARPMCEITVVQS